MFFSSIKPTFIDITHLCLFSVTKQFCNFASNFYIILYVSEGGNALYILKNLQALKLGCYTFKLLKDIW